MEVEVGDISKQNDSNKVAIYLIQQDDYVVPLEGPDNFNLQERLETLYNEFSKFLGLSERISFSEWSKISGKTYDTYVLREFGQKLGFINSSDEFYCI
jgi:hypothetical protein